MPGVVFGSVYMRSLSTGEKTNPCGDKASAGRFIATRVQLQTLRAEAVFGGHGVGHSSEAKPLKRFAGRPAV